MSVGPDVAPKPESAAGAGRLGAALLHILSVHGLLAFGLFLVLVFSVLLPQTFTGIQTFRAILGNNTTVALLALAEMLVISTGNYDLSIAYNVGLMHILAMGLLTDASLPWPLVVVGTIAAGGLVGWINGALVEFARIDSFIATLGVGTILYGLGSWYTNGTQLVGNVPMAFAAINDARLLGIPLPTYMVAAVALLLWLCLEYTPTGRRLYAIGANRRAAELTGVPARRLVMGAFVGALLGATTVKPGRVNAWGTIIAVLVLAVGIAGLQQLGNSFFVEPIFQGAALIISVGLAGYAARRRRR
jgi:ribose transport system permease protein